MYGKGAINIDVLGRLSLVSVASLVSKTHTRLTTEKLDHSDIGLIKWTMDGETTLLLAVKENYT